MALGGGLGLSPGADRLAREEGRGGMSITGFFGFGAVLALTTACTQVRNPWTGWPQVNGLAWTTLAVVRSDR